jgi:hypothetical protein
MQAVQEGQDKGKAGSLQGARTTELVGIDDIGLPAGIQPENGQPAGAGDALREDVDRLERAAGPHGARTTELVGIDDIGLPSGLQPEDVALMPSASGSSDTGGGNPPEKVRIDSPELAPGDEAAPGTIGSGEDTCPVCGGSGKNASGASCPNCRGTGKITEGIGGG